MFIKKLIISCFTVALISVPSITVYANEIPTQAEAPSSPANSDKDHKRKHKSLDSMTSSELRELANKLEIDTTDLTDDQLKEKIKECKPKHHRLDKMTSPELKSLAEKLKIDTTDLSDEQLKEKIKEAIKEKKLNKK